MFALGLSLLLLAGPASADPDHHAVLGLTGDANPLQVHLAYVNLTKSFKVPGKTPLEHRSRLHEIQQAFEALGDADSKEEALSALSYWEHVRHLEDDEDLQRFAELQAGGSAHLRILFVTDQPGQRRWGVFSAAVRLYGRARVAHLYKADVARGRFFSSFKLRQYPAAVMYDPISRGMRVAYSIDGVGEESQRLLDGSLAPGDRIARVQELDLESHHLRCAAKTCTWTVAIATSSAFEQRRDNLLMALRPFVDACQKLQLHDPHLVCFWLRFGRAPQWEKLARREGAPEDELTLLAFRSGHDSLAVAPPGKAGSAGSVEAWVKDVLSEKEPQRPAVLPPFPQAILPEEEPEEDPTSQLFRNLRRWLDRLQSKVEDSISQAEGNFKKMDTEDKTMLAGVVLCVLMAVLVFCRQCCCCSRRAGLSENDVVQQLLPVVKVQLQRGGGEKLGLGIAPSTQGGFTITGVNSGDLVDRWNVSQPLDVFRVRKGDRIISVTTLKASGNETVNTPSAIQNALRVGDNISLAVALVRTQDEVVLSTATVVLEGLSLQQACQLSVPQHTWGGPQKDDKALEIASLSPELMQLNQRRQQEGTCSLQQLQVGDRIVSANGTLDVRACSGASAPILVVVRWRPSAAMRSERFRVEIERSGPEDRLGMHIRPQPGGEVTKTEVLDVAAGGAIARWNSQGVKPVHKGDCIVSVNGKTKDVQKHLAATKVDIEFERWVDSNPDFHGQAKGPLASSFAAAAPTVAVPKAMASPTPAQETPSQGTSLFSWPMMVIGALLLAAFVFGDKATAQLVLSQLRVLESLSASVRSSLLAVNPNDQAATALTLLLMGCFLTLWFLWYEVRMIRRPKQRHFFSQLVVALIASFYLGCGNFVLLIWAGVKA